MSAVAESIAGGRLSGRLWFYANYHCNLRCSYCLTESAPLVKRRELGAEQILERAAEAAELGFTGFGVTGGEPFILDYMPQLVGALADDLPVIVLSNATLFNERRLAEIEPLADKPVHVQISLDRPDPVRNDEMRGPENFRKVVEAVPKLVERGVGVRIATTLEDPDAVDPHEMEQLCELHRRLGVPDEITSCARSSTVGVPRVATWACSRASSSSSRSLRSRPTAPSTARSRRRWSAGDSTPICSSLARPLRSAPPLRRWCGSSRAARKAPTRRSGSGERDRLLARSGDQVSERRVR